MSNATSNLVSKTDTGRAKFFQKLSWMTSCINMCGHVKKWVVSVGQTNQSTSIRLSHWPRLKFGKKSRKSCLRNKSVRDLRTKYWRWNHASNKSLPKKTISTTICLFSKVTSECLLKICFNWTYRHRRIYTNPFSKNWESRTRHCFQVSAIWCDSAFSSTCWLTS